MSKKEQKFKESRIALTLSKSGGLDALLGEPATAPPTGKKKRGRPKTSSKIVDPGDTPEIGTKEGERRVTYIVDKELISKVEAVAYWDRVMIKEVIDRALRSYFTSWEKANGEIKPKNK